MKIPQEFIMEDMSTVRPSQSLIESYTCILHKLWVEINKILHRLWVEINKIAEIYLKCASSCNKLTARYSFGMWHIRSRKRVILLVFSVECFCKKILQFNFHSVVMKLLQNVRAGRRYMVGSLRVIRPHIHVKCHSL